MKTSLLITTYNWPEALELVLLSALRQSRLPDEVVVADDGSGPATRALLEAMAARYPVPLRHVWQDDVGFRAARARNRALAACGGDYVLMVDGDMVLHRHFVADHLRAARPGRFVQGVRVLTGREAAQRMLAERRLELSPFDSGVRRRRHTLRLPPLARLLLAVNERQTLRGIKTCNQGWWRNDLLRLNGFDERMMGWGREDEELAARAFHAGLQRRCLRFAGLAVHLWHPERHADGESANDRWLGETLARRSVRADAGMDLHLAEFAATPAADLRLALRAPAPAAADGEPPLAGVAPPGAMHRSRERDATAARGHGA